MYHASLQGRNKLLLVNKHTVQLFTREYSVLPAGCHYRQRPELQGWQAGPGKGLNGVVGPLIIQLGPYSQAYSTSRSSTWIRSVSA
jgi:hypothetical protein